MFSKITQYYYNLQSIFNLKSYLVLCTRHLGRGGVLGSSTSGGQFTTL